MASKRANRHTLDVGALDWALWRELARREGLTVSEWIRRACYAHASRFGADIGPTSPDGSQNDPDPTLPEKAGHK